MDRESDRHTRTHAHTHTYTWRVNTHAHTHIHVEGEHTHTHTHTQREATICSTTQKYETSLCTHTLGAKTSQYTVRPRPNPPRPGLAASSCTEMHH